MENNLSIIAFYSANAIFVKTNLDLVGYYVIEYFFVTPILIGRSLEINSP